MSFLKWLSRLFRPTPSGEEMPNERLPPLDLSALQSRTQAEGRSAASVARPRQWESSPSVPTLINGAEWVMDYTPKDRAGGKRHVLPLFGSPNMLLTAIDLSKRRVRTYRTDRISLVRTAQHPDGRPAESELSERPDLQCAPSHALQPAEEVALIMRKEMYPQLALFRLISGADGTLSAPELDCIVEYARRDNRFAVKGFVPTGDKRAVWPRLRDMITSLPVEESFVDVYVGSLLEEWENQRRADLLSQYLTRLAHINGAVHPVAARIAHEVNRASK